MKNAFGGLIPSIGTMAHKMIHEVLVDLLAIQKKTIMASRSYGWLRLWKRAGPRTMGPFYGDVILASSDQVAIDALAAKIMGFEPLKIDYIKWLMIGDWEWEMLTR